MSTTKNITTAVLIYVAILLGCVEVNNGDSTATATNLGPSPVIAPLPEENVDPSAPTHFFVFEVLESANVYRQILALDLTLGDPSTVRLSVFPALPDGARGAELSSTEVGQISVTVRNEGVATLKEIDGRNLTFSPVSVGDTFATVSTTEVGAVQLPLVVN